MSADRSHRLPKPDWVRAGRGIGPSVRWTFATDAPLTGLQLARETGEVLAADETGGLYRIDRRGEYSAVNRLREPIREIAWSDDGQSAVALVGDSQIHRFDRRLQIEWTLNLPELCLQLAIDPYGQYLVVSLADSGNLVFDAMKRRIAGFETIRPLKHLRFLTTESTIVGAAEHGLICCHALDGEQIWQEKLWSNVGEMTTTGDGDLIYIAGFTHGVQTFDGHGDAIGSYIVEGTVNRLATSYEPHRLIAATVERHLYWLDADGELLWSALTPCDVVRLSCDPLGEWTVIGFADGKIICLDWSRS